MKTSTIFKKNVSLISFVKFSVFNLQLNSILKHSGRNSGEKIEDTFPKKQLAEFLVSDRSEHQRREDCID